jgi:hypothetical protein
LPILYKLSSRYKIYTIFNSKDALVSLKKNKNLFILWSKINNKYFVNNIYNKFIYKIFFRFSNFFRLTFLNDFFLDKIHELDIFRTNTQIDFKEIKYIFLTFNNFSSWPDVLKKYNKKIKIIRYPEAQHIWQYNSRYNKKFYKFENLISDIIILQDNAKIFSKKFMDKKKIIYSGVPKFSNFWIKKFLKKNKNNKNIVIATRPPYKGNLEKDYFSTESYNYLVSNIFKLGKKFKNYKLIFKLHPNGNEHDAIRRLARENNFYNYEISDQHLFVLGKNSRVCISFYSSAVLDFLTVNNNIIEFWRNDVDNIDFIRDKVKKKWVSIYSKLNLVNSVDNYNDLDNMVSKVILSKKSIEPKGKNKYFNKINKNINDYIKSF